MQIFVKTLTGKSDSWLVGGDHSGGSGGVQDSSSLPTL